MKKLDNFANCLHILAGADLRWQKQTIYIGIAFGKEPIAETREIPYNNAV